MSLSIDNKYNAHLRQIIAEMDASPADVANTPEMILGGNKPRNVTLNESLPYANPLHDVLSAEVQLSVDAVKGSGVVEDVSKAVKKVSKSKAAKKVGKVAKKVASKVLDEAQKSAGAAGAAGGVALATAIAQPELAPTLAVVGKKVAEAVIDGSVKRGIVICGTGIGISIAANRIAGVRAALCNDVTTARLSREHNDANVLALGARQTARELAEEIVDTFLATDLEGGRHAVRVAKIDETKFFLDSVDNTSNL